MPDAKSSSKRCFKCGETKPLDQFYRHNQMADGHLSKCKDCTKADVIAHRERNLEKVKAYDRQRSNLPHRVAARRAYQKTDRFRDATRKAKAVWENTNPHKRLAVNSVNNAIRTGKIKKPDACSRCGETACRIEGHHPDYSKPLDVIWLCETCHKLEHKRLREISRKVAA
jgi:formylmethanofuran dehydrogenase subunit E